MHGSSDAGHHRSSSALRVVGIAIGLVGLTALPAFAQDAAAYDKADTAWLLTCSALVLMMTIPGLALFYGGLVRSKNVLSTLMHSFFCAALISVTWVLFGYSLAFGTDVGGVVGGLDKVMLSGLVDSTSGSVPELLFVAFQCTFAIITPALISGAFAERIRFPAFALYMLLWSTLIYAPLCHWVWGGGWIATKIGALDFAGGTVVHISSGIAALVTVLVLGPRKGLKPGGAIPPHNLPFTVVGAALLWVGWFGFNAGSALAADGLASLAFVNTNTAAAAAALAWLVLDQIRLGKPTALGAATGAVAGLVCITPAAGFVTPGASVIFGLAAGVLCQLAIGLKSRLGYDDALDVVGVHGVGGTLGAVLTGVFATAAVNSGIGDLTGGLPGGLIDGHGGLVVKQILAVLATFVFCGVGTWIILMVVNLITPLRASEEDEYHGLDRSQHKEQAYPQFQTMGDL